MQETGKASALLLNDTGYSNHGKSFILKGITYENYSDLPLDLSKTYALIFDYKAAEEDKSSLVSFIQNKAKYYGGHFPRNVIDITQKQHIPEFENK